LLKRAIDLSPSIHQRIELLIALRAALWTAGEREASEVAAHEASALLAANPDEGLEHRRRLTEFVFGGRVTIAETQAAYAYFERDGDGMGMIRALEVAVSIHEYEDRWAAAVETLERAIAMALGLGRPDRALTVAARSAWILYYSPLPVPEALARLRQFLDMAGSNRYARALILIELGRLEAQTGVRDRWRRPFDAAKAIIDDLGLLVPLGVATFPHKLGVAEIAAGDPARVVEMLRDSCSTLDSLGLSGPLSQLASITSEALHAVGRLDEAEHYACWGRDAAQPNAPDAQVDWRIAMTGVRSAQGHHDEAITLIREALAIIPADSEDFVYLGRARLSLASALRAAGEEHLALEAAHEAQRLASAKQDRTALRKIEAFLLA
jgi:tetratricopeptide (TPR) repeat protein